ncbi:MAG TPA: KH domain-containing protein [Pyrinomonadaceae bacterium]|nr:KH domain-containing protein [Acidobacteriota bacterium]HQZ95951.1 KH domain-containing protein [Pyrinomonadaceae bacterium]
MKEAVERIIKALVGEPDAVEVSESGDGKNVRIAVRVAESDMGRIIGREGRTIKAIRSILFIAGQKQNKRFQLDLVED